MNGSGHPSTVFAGRAAGGRWPAPVGSVVLARGLLRMLVRLLACMLTLVACMPAVALAAEAGASAMQDLRAAGCEAVASRAPTRPGQVSLLGAVTLARAAEGPTRDLGGVSGVDFDPVRGLWWLLSDDRGDRAPPRAYPAHWRVTAQGFGPIRIDEPVALPLFDGEVPDPEALRFAPCLNHWVWASEGLLARGQPPAVRGLRWPESPSAAHPSPVLARPLGALALPRWLQGSDPAGPDAASGPRANRNIEGLAFTPQSDALWVALEAPLLQDGPEPDPQRGALLRFAKVPLAGGAATAQAYEIGPIRRMGEGGRRRADIGVSEILTLAGGQLLVIERNGYEVADGQFAFAIALFVADPDTATEVSNLPTLVGANVRPMRKRLLLDLAELGLPWIDNIEAAAWGPRLPDGRAVLILVSDDNFATNQVTQLIALAIEDLP